MPPMACSDRWYLRAAVGDAGFGAPAFDFGAAFVGNAFEPNGQCLRDCPLAGIALYPHVQG